VVKTHHGKEVNSGSADSMQVNFDNQSNPIDVTTARFITHYGGTIRGYGNQSQGAPLIVSDLLYERGSANSLKKNIILDETNKHSR
jgi:hypothetical protein